MLTYAAPLGRKLPVTHVAINIPRLRRDFEAKPFNFGSRRCVATCRKEDATTHRGPYSKDRRTKTQDQLS